MAGVTLSGLDGSPGRPAGRARSQDGPAEAPKRDDTPAPGGLPRAVGRLQLRAQGRAEAVEEVGEARGGGVLGREGRVGDRPGDADGGVVPGHRQLVVRGRRSRCTCTRRARARSTTQKPWAKPGGTQSWRKFSPERTKPTHLPNVGEPRRMSTATSNISPSTARTSLPWGLRSCACSPRRVPRAEYEWLSWTKGPGMPPSAYFLSW